MASVRSLLFQYSLRIFHQCGVKEADAKIAPKGTENRDVTISMHIAWMPPLNGFDQAQTEADSAEFEQALVPPSCRAIGGGKAFAASAAIRKILVDVGDHGNAPLSHPM